MEYTIGKYRCNNGAIANIDYRHHGLFLSGTVDGTIRNKAGDMHRWLVDPRTAPYIGSAAKYVAFGGKRLDKGYDLLEKL